MSARNERAGSTGHADMRSKPGIELLDYDVAVIGGGPAGLAAALSAKRSGAEKVVIIERASELGGILPQCIHNGFGLHYFGEELTGPEYAYRFIKELRESDIEVKLESMVLELSSDRRIVTVNPKDGIVEISSNAVVLAMGCRERTRGSINIPGTRPAGVYTAGATQRYVNLEGYLPGKKIFVLGSGDIGLIMARRLTLEGAKVIMVCELMPYSCGLNRNIVQCVEDFGIPIRFEHTVTKIHGKERVEGVTVSKVDDKRKPIPGTEEFFECDTLLLSVGLIPENELSRLAGVALDARTGGPLVNENMETSIEGIFACGNVVHVHDLVDNVTEEANRAGKHAAEYVTSSSEGRMKKEEKSIELRTSLGVRYTVPQLITKRAASDVTVFFRVTDVYRNSRLVVEGGGRALVSQNKKIMTPGEMQSVTLKKELIEEVLRKDHISEITFRVEGRSA